MILRQIANSHPRLLTHSSDFLHSRSVVRTLYYVILPLLVVEWDLTQRMPSGCTYWDNGTATFVVSIHYIQAKPFFHVESVV
jgi:hypothetical protein